MIPSVGDDMSTSLRLTIDQYERMIARGAFECLDKRIEFIDGELREMSPAGPVHDDYIQYLMMWAQASTLAAIRCQMGIRIHEHLPEPDLALIKPKRYGHERPSQDDVSLIVEVAESSLSYDLNEKARLYAAGGVPEYWVVDVVNSRLHRHRTALADRFAIVEVLQRPSKITPQFDPDLTLDLDDLFLEDEL